MKRLLLLIFLFIITISFARAQQSTPLFDFSFNHDGIEKVVSTIQSKTNCKFYYDPHSFDSLKVTIELKQKTLKQTLDSVFKKAIYHYAFVSANEVVLTNGAVIRTELVTGFFLDKPTNQPANETITDSDKPEKKVITSTSENKIYDIGFKNGNSKNGSAVLNGTIKDAKSGEPVIGASVYVAALKVGTASNQFGNFTLNLPKGSQTLIIKAAGMKDTRRQIVIHSDGVLNIELQEQITALREVKISADKVANTKSVEMGMAKLDIKNIKLIPAVFGEADVLRVVLTLPGVQSVGEASTGFNVRGGSADQNLILLNDATIYNPAHFFGFFSAFDPDIIQDVELYKSSIPEKFGGRLSSVLNITEREGNKKKFTGTAGIGLITSRFNIEGPIDKD